MKALYVTSIESYSGKTALCLAIGRKLRAAMKLVGYLKPLSIQPRRVNGRLMDEDAIFVARALELEETPETLAPVIVTFQLLEERLSGSLSQDLAGDVLRAFQKASANKDMMLLEGGASLREG